MPKEATEQERFSYSAAQVYEHLTQNIAAANDMHLNRSDQTANGYVLDVQADKGVCSNKGEAIDIRIERLGEAKILVSVSSRLKASLQTRRLGQKSKKRGANSVLCKGARFSGDRKRAVENNTEQK